MKRDQQKFAKITPFTLAVAAVSGAVTAMAIKTVQASKAKKAARLERRLSDAALPEDILNETELNEVGRPFFSATYTKAGSPDGYAAGTVTVTVNLPEEEAAQRRIVMYWGNDEGRLEGYTALPLLKVQGEVTTYTFGRHVLIPEGATKLMVYTTDTEGNLSEECVVLDLPEGAAHPGFEASDAEMWVMSDIHLTLDQEHTHNRNFASMLENVKAVSPEALGLFVVGDMANSGQEGEYQNMVALHEAAGDVPPLFLTLGNHDFYNNSFEEGRAKFLRYAKLPNGTHPETPTYDYWLGGYHFISLSTDEPDGLDAIFHQSTMDWLREKLEEDRDPARPAFIFLHQSLYNTVSGSLPGERWHGVKNDQMLRDVLADFPEAVFFNGHSHWTMDSLSNMFEETPELPCSIFNCASVGYLWTGINVVTGEHLNGSQGYLVKICGSTLYVLGRDFCTGEWVSAAQYRVELDQKI